MSVRPANWTTVKGALKRAAKPGRRGVRARIEYWRNAKAFVDGARCCVCGKESRLQVHHTRGRAGALLCDERFWVAVCHACHCWIHANPEKARARGLLCEKGLWNKPPKENE